MMAAVFVSALAATVPDRRAVELERHAVDALRAADYAAAADGFAGVLVREPRSTFARWGLACTFLSTGHASRAMLELTMAINRGLVLRAQTVCANGVKLERRFAVAKLGAVLSFAVPRGVAPASYLQALESVPAENAIDDAHRFLLGSCLAFRAGLDGAGWYYAANARYDVALDRVAERVFFACLGPATTRRLGCPQPPRLAACVFTRRPWAAYQRDRPYLYPEDAPAAFADAS